MFVYLRKSKWNQFWFEGSRIKPFSANRNFQMGWHITIYYYQGKSSQEIETGKIHCNGMKYLNILSAAIANIKRSSLYIPLQYKSKLIVYFDVLCCVSPRLALLCFALLFSKHGMGKLQFGHEPDPTQLLLNFWNLKYLFSLMSAGAPFYSIAIRYSSRPRDCMKNQFIYWSCVSLPQRWMD